MMKRIITLLLIILAALPAWAQEKFDLSGILKDEFNEGAIGATAQVKDEQGTYVSGAAAEDDGSFVVHDLTPGKYSVTFSFIGLEDIVREFQIVDKDINLGILKFKSSSTALKGVEVKGNRIAVQQSGDTTDYNAAAFKVNPNATAEDLVRKMPGIDLSGGQVKAQGENVGKVLVDGKPFFGDDAANTLKNLPAEVISKIQVYDEKSEQSRMTGVDDGETIKAINIVTKAEKREGVFGKVYAGGGVDAQTLFNNNG